MKEFGSSLEVSGWKERAQSLSSINILISPCTSSLKPPQSPSQMEASLDKVRLEAAASSPPSSSSVALHGGAFPSLSDCRVQPPAEEEQGVETRSSTAGPSHSRHSNTTEVEFPVGEDQMYPTLRSKSWRENPRKTKKEEEEEKLQSSASLKDLASAFTEVLQSRVEPRVSDGGTC